MNFTDESREHWDSLSDEEKVAWTTDVTCQKCYAKVDSNAFNVSMYEGQIALFHLCTQCGNKEVRLIDANNQSQKAIDDDFEQWVKSKREKHPERFED